jgi:hypothetical protein
VNAEPKNQKIYTNIQGKREREKRRKYRLLLAITSPWVLYCLLLGDGYIGVKKQKKAGRHHKQKIVPPPVAFISKFSRHRRKEEEEKIGEKEKRVPIGNISNSHTPPRGLSHPSLAVCLLLLPNHIHLQDRRFLHTGFYTSPILYGVGLGFS